jgi:hypothetical protein
MKTRIHVHDSSGATIVGELESRGKKRTEVQASSRFSKFQIEEFLQRLLGKGTSDEAAGHPFHGNQWVEVAGQKVNVSKTGTLKDKLMHLFTQGHKFTNQELATLLGESVDTIRSRLSKIKKETPPGGLFLERSASGHWSLKQADGELPTPVVPEAVEHEAETAISKAAKQALAPAPLPEPVSAVTVPQNAPEPQVYELMEPVPEPIPTQLTLAEKLLPELKEPTLPSAPLPKDKADNIYKATLELWGNQTAHAFPDASKVEPEAVAALAQGWKNTKANAMAQWSANVHGTVKAPIKAQAVFKADEQLVKDLIDGKPFDQAQADWKLNTAGEKAGTWPPDPDKEAVAEALKAHKAAEEAKAKADAEFFVAAKKEAQEAALAEAYKEHAPHFDVISDYVPDDHIGILLHDFPSVYKSEITKLKSTLSNGHTDKIGNKIGVQKGLEQELAESKPFQAIKAQYAGKGSYASLEAELISEWAGSSGGHNATSNAAQLAIRDAFGMKQEHLYMGQLWHYTQHSGDEDKVYALSASQLGIKYETPAQKATFRAGLRDFVRAQYNRTQAHLKDKGIDHVYVARGSGGHLGIDKTTEASHGNITLQPASSFSANYGTARGTFSGGEAVYLVKVPASQVLSTYVTGYGCTNEHEVVVLAHPNLQAVRIPAGVGGHMTGSLEDAVNHVAATMKNAPTLSHQQMEASFAKLSTAQQKAHTIAVKAAEAGIHKPVLPKMPKGISNYTKSYVQAAKEASKKGDVAGYHAALAEFENTKLKTGYKFTATTPYMAKLGEHVNALAVYKEHEAKIKADLKVKTKAAKPQKKAVHVHIHEQTKHPSTIPASALHTAAWPKAA